MSGGSSGMRFQYPDTQLHVLRSVLKLQVAGHLLVPKQSVIETKVTSSRPKGWSDTTLMM